MKKSNILPFLLAASMMFSSVPAAAEEVPSVAELEAALDNSVKNIKKVKDLISTDYSGVINGSDELQIQIDENSVRELNRGVVGLQCELGNQEHLTIYKDGEMRADLIEVLKDAQPIPLVRFGGTSTSRHNYMLAGIGPVEKRTVSNSLRTKIGTDYLGGPALQAGIPEMIKTIQINNKDVAVVMCVGPLMDADTVIDFAHYLLDDKDESELGAMRAADGLEDPVNIAYWELGNELDGTGDIISDERIQWYIDWAEPVAKALKEEMPQQKVLFCGKTAAWDCIKYSPDHPAYRMKWEKKIFQAIAPYVDGITFHPYYDGYSSEYMMKIADLTKQSMDEEVERQQITDENGNLKDMVMVVTECSRWSDQTIHNTDFYSAVCTSHWLNKCFERDYIKGTAYHNAFTEFPYWCMFWGKKDDRYYKGPAVKLYDLYLSEMGDRIVDSRVIFDEEPSAETDGTEDEDDRYTPRNFSVFVSAKGDNELKVILTNREAYTQRNIKFSFNNKYKLVKEAVFTAPNAATISVDEESEESVKVIEYERNINDFSEYEMKGLGVVALTLKTDSKIGGVGSKSDTDDVSTDAPEAEKAAFADVENSPFKNEITALYNNGAVSGNADGSFRPQDKITNAEFAVMLSKILGLRTDYKGSHWADVTPGAWYSGAANALYIENILGGTEFNAFGNVKISGAMDILGRYIMDKKGVPQGDIKIENERLSAYGAYCIRLKIFDGLMRYGDLVLEDTLTREQAADILYRFGTIAGGVK